MEMEMEMPRRAREGQIDQQRTPHEWFGVGKPIGFMQQLRQVVEVCSDTRMIRPETLLINFEGSAHKRLGLGMPIGILQQHRQVVKISSDTGMA